MKNLHLIATDKPSRLLLSKRDYYQFLKDNASTNINNHFEGNYQHIYITSDEEDINNNDYIITKDGRLVQVSYLLSKDLEGASKVILTTDRDLIRDGVQAIDDEFLEWFIKNPSCEWVEVEDTCLEVKVCDCAMNENCLKPGYTIIIPQEEPIQELNLTCFDCNKSLQDCTCIEDTINMKQETLEEAADNWVRQPIIGTKRESFIAGYKLAQERMYSEEEVKQIIDATLIEYSDFVLADIPELFEQFKKK